MHYSNPYYAVGSLFTALFSGFRWILLAALLVLAIYAVVLLIQCLRKVNRALDIWLGRNRPERGAGAPPPAYHGPAAPPPWDWNGAPQGQAYQPSEPPIPPEQGQPEPKQPDSSGY